MIRGSGYGDGCVVWVLMWHVAHVRLISMTKSYGGFMSSKVVEADAGIHSLAMAVAVRGLSPALFYPFSLRLRNLCSRQPAGVCMVSPQPPWSIWAVDNHGCLCRFDLHGTVHGPPRPEPGRVRERVDSECNGVG